VQHLLVISDPTQRGIVAAHRIADFRHQLDIAIENCYLIINGLDGEVPTALQERIDAMGIPLLGTVPRDPAMLDFEIQGRPLIDLPDKTPLFAAISSMLGKILTT
jgi:CO dehydrogenase maturation factor